MRTTYLAFLILTLVGCASGPSETTDSKANAETVATTKQTEADTAGRLLSTQGTHVMTLASNGGTWTFTKVAGGLVASLVPDGSTSSASDIVIGTDDTHVRTFAVRVAHDSSVAASDAALRLLLRDITEAKNAVPETDSPIRAQTRTCFSSLLTDGGFSQMLEGVIELGGGIVLMIAGGGLAGVAVTVYGASNFLAGLVDVGGGCDGEG